jgi:putative flavoprotein involved in K+ transport
VRLRDDLARNIVFADAASAALRSRMDAHIARSGADAPPADADPADHPYPTQAIPPAHRDLDLRRAGVTTLIWATGFDPDIGFIDAPVVGQRDHITQPDGAPRCPACS